MRRGLVSSNTVLKAKRLLWSSSLHGIHAHFYDAREKGVHTHSLTHAHTSTHTHTHTHRELSVESTYMYMYTVRGTLAYADTLTKA